MQHHPTGAAGLQKSCRDFHAHNEAENSAWVALGGCLGMVMLAYLIAIRAFRRRW